MAHIFYGWGFAVIIMLALLYAGSKFRDPDSPLVETSNSAPKPRPSSGAFLAVALPLIPSISFGPVFSALRAPSRNVPDLSTLQDSFKDLGWSAVPLSGDWVPAFNAPSAKFQASLTRSG